MSVTISGDGTITGVLVDKRIEAFTSSGTWTVPAGVTYAIAHMMGGGGGLGTLASGGNGGNSSVAFASGTVTGTGLTKVQMDNTVTEAVAGAANTGQSASGMRASLYANAGPTNNFVVAGAAVTPAESITVTVGAGGTAGTSGAAGGSGYVFIEYYV